MRTVGELIILFSSNQTDGDAAHTEPEFKTSSPSKSHQIDK
jgi:hypothetical protein